MRHKRELPQFLTGSAVARELGVSRQQFSNWEQSGMPLMPAPAAIVRADKFAYPVWAPSSLPAWRQWNEMRKTKPPEWRLAAARRRLELAQLAYEQEDRT